MPIDISVTQPYLGHPLFALCSAKDESYELKKRGKNPLVSEWQNSPPCLDLSRFVNGEVGYALEDDMLIIDVDISEGKQGLASINKLSHDHGFDYIKNATVKVLTGSGGVHLYYTKPKDLIIRKNHRSYPNLDFLSKGNFVVIAGCEHYTGGRYQWINRIPASLSEAIEAPDKLFDLLRKETHAQTPQTVQAAPTASDVSDDTLTYAMQVAEALEPAVEGNNGDNTAFKAVCTIRDLGVDQQTAYEVLRDAWNPKCSPPWSDSELRQKIINGYAYAQNKNPVSILGSLEELNAEVIKENFVYDPNEIGPHNWIEHLEMEMTYKGPKMRRSVYNCRLFLRYAPKLRNMLAYNVFSGRVILIRKEEWLPNQTIIPTDGLAVTDGIVARLKNYIMDRYREEFSVNALNETIDLIAYDHQLHPVQGYLKGLLWDGEDRITHWLSRYCTVEDTEYTQAVGKRWLVGAVKRIFEPGCQMDSMLIFYGAQGVGKTTLARILAGDWYLPNLTDLNASGKGSEERLLGKWIVEIAELDAFKKTDMSKIKEFLTRNIDTYRASYGRRAQDYPRQCVFLGTTNESHFLRDDENRRFWVVKCQGMFDLDALRADRDQIWAQAVDMYKNGAACYLETAELRALAHNISQQYAVTDPWQEMLRQYLDGANFEGKPMTEVELLTIFKECLGGPLRAAHVGEVSRIQHALKVLKWTERDGTWYRG